MKTTILAVLTSVLLGASAQADFIGLVVGYDYQAHGFHPPGALFKIINGERRNTLSLFDSASPGHWNGFGVLPGEGNTQYFTDLITNGAEAFASVNWDFNGLPHYSMSYLDVVGTRDSDGHIFESIYAVTGATRFDSLSHLLVTLDGSVDIENIAFYGRWPGNITVMPDGGTTALMFGTTLLGLAWVRRRIR